jgi:hypothetical protein
MVFPVAKVEYFVPPPMEPGESDPLVLLANEYGPVVKLDGWIQLKMDPEEAALALGLRSAVEAILVAVASNPSILDFPSSGGNERPHDAAFWDKHVLLQETLTRACSFSVGRRGLPEVDLVKIAR